MLVRASKCVCVYSLLLLHSCLFNILAYCISCGEEPDFPSMVLDCMITVMILNLVLILNNSSIQFILVNFSDRQLQILKKKKKFYPSLYTIIFLCNILRLCWCALCHSFLQRGSGFFVIWTHLYLIHDICWSIKVFKCLIHCLCIGVSLGGRGWKYGSVFVDGIFPVPSLEPPGIFPRMTLIIGAYVSCYFRFGFVYCSSFLLWFL